MDRDGWRKIDEDTDEKREDELEDKRWETRRDREKIRNGEEYSLETKMQSTQF